MDDLKVNILNCTQWKFQFKIKKKKIVGLIAGKLQMLLKCSLTLYWGYTTPFLTPSLFSKQISTRRRPTTLASGTSWWWTSARRRRTRSWREMPRSTRSSSRSTATALTRSSEPWTSLLWVFFLFCFHCDINCLFFEDVYFVRHCSSVNWQMKLFLVATFGFLSVRDSKRVCEATFVFVHKQSGD